MGDAGRIRGYRNATRTTQAQYGHARHQDTPNLPKTEQVSYACITAISGTFNPLFKVLCTFPSRYLFAIGLESIFSFGWNVPPTLRSHLREHDSENAGVTRRITGVELDCHHSLRFFPKDVHLHRRQPRAKILQRRAQGSASRYELFLLHSPLLEESFVVSFPPLTYMLKFRG